MTNDPTPIAAADADLRERALRQLDRLDELAGIGLDVARAVGRRAEAAEAGEDLGVLAMAYSRTARAVRQTVMLHDRLLKALQEADKASREAFHKAEFERRQEHKARVERIVERSARRRLGPDADAEAVERLVTEAAERLDDEDLYAEVLTRSVAALVAEICQALGLEPDWPDGMQAAWSEPPAPVAPAWTFAATPKPAAGAAAASERAILKSALAVLADSS